MENVHTKVSNMDTKMASTDTKLKNLETKMANFQMNMEGKLQQVNDEMRRSLNEVKEGFDLLKEKVLEKMEDNERRPEEIIRDDKASDRNEGQYILVAGDDRTNSVEIFNHRRRSWSLLKPMPENRCRATSFVYDNQAIVAGGCSLNPIFDNMIRMSIHPVPDISNNWSDFAAKLPAKMYAHSSVVYNDSLFVTGGYCEDVHTFSNSIHKVELKPPHIVTLVSNMPETRFCHSTILCDDNILIIGGKKSWNCKNSLSSVLRYDIKKNECHQLPDLPYPVSEMATVKSGENAVIIGGADKEENALNNVFIYDMKTGNSHMLPSMIHKRMGCAAVVIENTIVVLGGWGGWEGNSLNSVECFNFERFSWEELPAMSEGKLWTTAVVI